MLGDIVLVAVDREPVSAITHDDVKAEGFPDYSVPDFIAMFCRLGKCSVEHEITRIEFRHKLEVAHALSIADLYAREVPDGLGGSNRMCEVVEVVEDDAPAFARVRGLARVASRRLSLRELERRALGDDRLLLHVPPMTLIGRAFGARLAIVEWNPAENLARPPGVTFVCKPRGVGEYKKIYPFDLRLQASWGG